LEPFEPESNTPLLRLKSWEDEFPGLRAGFTTRTGGSSVPPFFSFNFGLHVGDNAQNVIENRRQLCRHLDFPFDYWTCAEQVHDNKVVVVDHLQRGRGRTDAADAIPDTDGLITANTNILLTSFYADCVPLLFISPRQRIIGVAHAGWKGTNKNIAKQMINTFKDKFQITQGDIKVAIGPSIGGCCYEVDDRVAEPLSAMIKPEVRNNYLLPTTHGKYMADLKKINHHLLVEAGVPEDNVVVSSWCTACRTDLLFSHRKEQGKTGRMAAYVGWQREV
jgi:YfiH family protein